MVKRGVASIADQAAIGAVTFIVSLFIGRALGAEGLGTYAATNTLFLLIYSTYDSVLLEPMSVFRAAAIVLRACGLSRLSAADSRSVGALQAVQPRVFLLFAAAIALTGVASVIYLKVFGIAAIDTTVVPWRYKGLFSKPADVAASSGLLGDFGVKAYPSGSGTAHIW